MPREIKITPLFDQSVFVKAAVKGVVAEALIAAALTAAMVLLFLGNWRSTLIIALTIPLSILTSILTLQMLGETLNLMTLGGLALSVGILVDQAIVTIENIERHLHMGTELHQAILVGAGEIGVPGVRVDAVHLHRVRADVLPVRRRALPVRAAGRSGRVRDDRVVHPVAHAGADARHAADGRAPSAPTAEPRACCSGSIVPSTRLRARAARLHARVVGAAVAAQGVRTLFLGFCVLSCLLYPVLGRDFFPSVDAGQIRLHMRAPTGTRIEETARLADEVEAAIRKVVPPDQLETILDNLGVPNSGINLSYSNAGTIGTLDGEILLSLREGHRPTDEFVSRLRAELPKRFPGIEFFFQPADIVTQILNFGLPAAIDVQFTGANLAANAALAAQLAKSIRDDSRRGRRARPPADGRPDLDLQMDRTRLQQFGLTAFNVGQNVLVSLSGSSQTAPAFWLNPQNGVVYNVAVQTPQYQVDSLDSLLNMPVGERRRRHALRTAARSCSAIWSRRRPGRQLAVVSRYNISPAVDLYVSVQGTDLASVAAQVHDAGRRDAARAPARQPGHGARPGADDAVVVHRPRRRPRDGDRARLSADRRQLPVVDRRRHHRRRACRPRSRASPGCCSSPARRSACRR